MQKKIIFYEWSNLKNTPIVFDNKESFYDFCRFSNIRTGNREVNFIDNNREVYCTCKNGKAELIMSGDRRNLQKNVSKYRCTNNRVNV